jgi:PKHD-type hydroxylase
VLVQIPAVLSPEQVGAFRASLDAAGWVDGRRTAGYQAKRVKDNAQLAEDDPVARSLGDTLLEALERTSLFVSAALPLKVYPPMFNRYAGGQVSACMWTPPSARCRARRTGCERICRRRCS